MDAARHDEVARALGSALDQDGRLDFQKVAFVHVAADQRHQIVSQDDVVPLPGPAQIEVSVFEAQSFVYVDFFVYVKRRSFRFRQYLKPRRLKLYLARGQLRVQGAGRPFGDHPAHGDNVLGSKLLAGGVSFRRPFGAEDHLGNAVSVPQIDEDKAAVIAPPVDPAVENYFVTGRGRRATHRTWPCASSTFSTPSIGDTSKQIKKPGR